MKRLSICFKITLWFTSVLIIVASLTYLIVFSVSNRIIQKTIRDNLIEAVEHNVDEIEYYASIDELISSNDVDHYVEYGGGYLEVDDDFLDQVNNVYTALYREDVTLLYGENPISRDTSSIGFVDSAVQTLRSDGTLYYVFDRKLTAKGLSGLWLRGVVSETQGAEQMSSITRISLILLPLLVLAASLGGYFIAGRTLRPIQKISDTARQIGESSDLKKRIELGEGKDELHQLADSFNDMFRRIDELLETERRFTADASHELRTPMSVITAQCEYTLEKPRDADEYEEALQVIRRQGNKMSGLINDMLAFTRLESQSDRYIKETLDLTGLVTDLCSDMALIRENGIKLDFQAEESCKYYGCFELLSRLLTNLISNAYRYGRKNGHIFVCLKRTQKGFELSVSDDGVGIAAEEQQKIFRRFYQVNPSRSGTGSGLGLSMALEIARFHHGELKVESELGKGSVFTLFLPE